MELYPLNAEQRWLVEENHEVVNEAIKSVIVNENIFGLNKDDLTQEACLLLMKAAQHYDALRGEFRPYAKKVIINGLRTYTRLICRKEKWQFSSSQTVSAAQDDEGCTVLSTLADSHVYQGADDRGKADAILRMAGSSYPPAARLGIEAIILAMDGYKAAEIAQMHDVKVQTINARIKRARIRLRKSPIILEYLQAG